MNIYEYSSSCFDHSAIAICKTKSLGALWTPTSNRASGFVPSTVCPTRQWPTWPLQNAYIDLQNPKAPNLRQMHNAKLFEMQFEPNVWREADNYFNPLAMELQPLSNAYMHIHAYMQNPNVWGKLHSQYIELPICESAATALRFPPDPQFESTHLSPSSCIFYTFLHISLILISLHCA